MAEPSTSTSTGDLENQQFLSIADYRPEDITKSTQNGSTSKITPSSTSINNISSQNPELSHAHPTAAFFTVIFKVASIALYLFGSWFSDNFVIVFVIVILAVAADFWSVKNVTGRLLVGLRWWNEVKDDGSSEWKFESRADGRVINKRDSNLFWGSLYLTPVIWFLLALAAIMKFNLKWLPLTIVGLSLSGAQLFGYWKCQRDQNKKIQDLIQKGIHNVGTGLVNAQINAAFRPK